jgi:hypothetical protein
VWSCRHPDDSGHRLHPPARQLLRRRDAADIAVLGGLRQGSGPLHVPLRISLATAGDNGPPGPLAIPATNAPRPPRQPRRVTVYNPIKPVSDRIEVILIVTIALLAIAGIVRFVFLADIF